MEEVLIPIDSRYRNTKLYPSEGKFTINLDKCYKNIVSANLFSIEITNSLNLIEKEKMNNYFTLYLPNKLNDPDGIKISLDSFNGVLDSVVSIKNTINSLLNETLNTNSKLYVTNKEKYFYIFYLNSATTISFGSSIPSLIINAGWMSVYGLVQQIYNWVFVVNKKSSCQINAFSLNVYDRRVGTTCVRTDNIGASGILNNLQDIKNYIYPQYITDTTNFIPNGTGTGILDILIGTSNYSSIYYIANDFTNVTNPTITTNSIQLYNILMDNKFFPAISSFSNSFLNYKSTTEPDKTITFYVNYNNSNWAPLSNFINKQFLATNSFISPIQLADPLFTPDLSKDIPQFEIDFSTGVGSYTNPAIVPPNSKSAYPNTPYSNEMTYKSLGYYLGFRPNPDNFILTSSINLDNPLLSSIMGTKKFNTRGDVYIFLKINDWGYINFFDKTMFSKILFFNYEHNMKIDNYYIMREYIFRQPTNVQKLEIELIDYLGNTVDLNGVDFSFTLSLKQVFNTDQKAAIEKKNLVFTN